jgi:DNA-binding transcriptional ArsR family regulator
MRRASCHSEGRERSATAIGLAHVNRVRILPDSGLALNWRDEPHSVNEIAAHFDITQQAVSQHLHVLKDAGLVAVRPVGQRRLYAVRTEGLESVRELLEQMWPPSLQHLKDAVEREENDGG